MYIILIKVYREHKLGVGVALWCMWHESLISRNSPVLAARVLKRDHVSGGYRRVGHVGMHAVKGYCSQKRRWGLREKPFDWWSYRTPLTGWLINDSRRRHRRRRLLRLYSTLQVRFTGDGVRKGQKK